jgi:LPXTG-motif cell wall-anchored protein
MRRASTVVAAAILIVGGLGGQSAAAATLPVCGGSTGSAGIPGNTCDVDATAECVSGTTQIRYAVTPTATPASVDITWTNTPGSDVTLTGQALSGTLVWPAASARTATLVFGTNPAVSVDVVNACASAEGAVLASGPRTTRSSGVLAATGAAGPALAIGAGALLVGGTSLVLLRRTRRDSL